MTRSSSVKQHDRMPGVITHHVRTQPSLATLYGQIPSLSGQIEDISTLAEQ